MSLLTIVQSVSLRVLGQKPSVAAASTDPKILQIIEMVNEEGQELNARYPWQVNRNEASFTTVATTSQGSLTTLCGADFSHFVNETMWNRSQRRPIPGPLSPAEWQLLEAQFSSGPWLQYTTRGNQLLFFPVPSAGQSVFFEWMSRNWCTTADGLTGQSSMVTDTDIAKLSERVITLGARWRFKKENHLEYEEDFQAYEKAVADATSRDGSKMRRSLNAETREFFPSIVVPAGNWNQ